ncbi:hypothetical protein HOK021_53850 [Streptomyces hygroscopicus]|nr:hypothetical protein HOK021_53850 [Streptomyces hygroscopicus]
MADAGPSGAGAASERAGGRAASRGCLSGEALARWTGVGPISEAIGTASETVGPPSDAGDGSAASPGDVADGALARGAADGPTSETAGGSTASGSGVVDGALARWTGFRPASETADGNGGTTSPGGVADDTRVRWTGVGAVAPPGGSLGTNGAPIRGRRRPVGGAGGVFPSALRIRPGGTSALADRCATGWPSADAARIGPPAE